MKYILTWPTIIQVDFNHPNSSGYFLFRSSKPFIISALRLYPVILGVFFRINSLSCLRISRLSRSRICHCRISNSCRERTRGAEQVALADLEGLENEYVTPIGSASTQSKSCRMGSGVAAVGAEHVGIAEFWIPCITSFEFSSMQVKLH